MDHSRTSADLRFPANWWVYPISIGSALLALEIAASQMSRRYLWLMERKEALSNALNWNAIPTNPLDESPLHAEGLDASFRRRVESDERWVGWTTRLYVSMVLVTAISGFLSVALRSPFWYPLFLFLMPFVGAYFLWRSWQQGED